MSVLNFLWSVVFRAGFLGYLFWMLLQFTFWVLFTSLQNLPWSPEHFPSPPFHVYVKAPTPSLSPNLWLLLIGYYFPSSLSSGEMHFFSYFQFMSTARVFLICIVCNYLHVLSSFLKRHVVALISLFLACFSRDIILLLIHRGYYRNYIENSALVILLLLILVWVQLTCSLEFLYRIALVYFILP